METNFYMNRNEQLKFYICICIFNRYTIYTGYGKSTDDINKLY